MRAKHLRERAYRRVDQRAHEVLVRRVQHVRQPAHAVHVRVDRECRRARRRLGGRGGAGATKRATRALCTSTSTTAATIAGWGRGRCRRGAVRTRAPRRRAGLALLALGSPRVSEQTHFIRVEVPAGCNNALIILKIKFIHTCDTRILTHILVYCSYSNQLVLETISIMRFQCYRKAQPHYKPIQIL